MKEFVKSFGSVEFIIIIVIVVAILLALFIIIQLEKKERNNKDEESFGSFDDSNLEESVIPEIIPIEPEVIQEEYKIPEYSDIPYYEPSIINSDNNPLILVEDETPKPEIVYVEEEVVDSNQILETMTTKLINDEMEVTGPTKFEVEQEEKSIISYDELINTNYDIEKINEVLLADDGDEPISLKELYDKYQNTNEEQLDIEEDQVNKINNTSFISPVFGVYNKKKEAKKMQSDPMEQTVDLRELEMEIRKTEEFLNDLKKLKGKLD